MNIYALVLCLYIINADGGGLHEKFITEIELQCYFFLWRQKTEKKDKHPYEGTKQSLANTLEMWNFISKQVYSLLMSQLQRK